MLAQISISNYTIVASLEMEFASGMTVITGETGAGKSIMLDALGLCIGDRADSKSVRHGCERAEIIATFDIKHIPQATAWLTERDLHSGDECLLRRVITADGRSRAYINGSVSTLQDCAELGTILIDIHSQHAHQSLLRKTVQRELLDAYAGHKTLLRTVATCACDWLRKGRELALLEGAKEAHSSRTQLLSYQVEELDALHLQAEELSTLEAEQNLLANAEQVLSDAHQALEQAEALEAGTQQALKLLHTDIHATAPAANSRSLLESAAIQLSEARLEIQQHIDSVQVDPERLAVVQRRLENIYDIARKHRVVPEALTNLHQSLREELQGLADDSERVAQLQQEMAALSQQYAADAAQLGKKRRSAAKKLVQKTSAVLSSLAMEGCQFSVALHPLKTTDPHPHGHEEVEFLISTNPGAPPRPLGKIASGGELSRISLAIGVVTADTATVPSMVFDEVDVGIGGAVAEVVGKLLQTLAERTQVLCVTHLAQVAAQGAQHLQVTKKRSKDAVETNLCALSAQQKVEEIARMLGGVKITTQTLATAREMLQS